MEKRLPLFFRLYVPETKGRSFAELAKAIDTIGGGKGDEGPTNERGEEKIRVTEDKTTLKSARREESGKKLGSGCSGEVASSRMKKRPWPGLAWSVSASAATQSKENGLR